jgi:hypothetical protein
MNSKDRVPNCNASVIDLPEIFDNVVLFECEEASALADFERSDTWIGKIPCSAVKHCGNEVMQNEQ